MYRIYYQVVSHNIVGNSNGRDYCAREIDHIAYLEDDTKHDLIKMILEFIKNMSIKSSQEIIFNNRDTRFDDDYIKDNIFQIPHNSIEFITPIVEISDENDVYVYHDFLNETFMDDVKSKVSSLVEEIKIKKNKEKEKEIKKVEDANYQQYLRLKAIFDK